MEPQPVPTQRQRGVMTISGTTLFTLVCLILCTIILVVGAFHGFPIFK